MQKDFYFCVSKTGSATALFVPDKKSITIFLKTKGLTKKQRDSINFLKFWK